MKNSTVSNMPDDILFKDKFSEALKKAYALEPGTYVTPKTSRIKKAHTMLTDMSAIGITNSASIHPVIGTYALDPCTGLLVWNKTTKTAAVDHKAKLTKHDFRRLLLKVRNNDPGNRDEVEVHVIGAPYAKITPERGSEYNIHTVDGLNALADDIAEAERTSNVKLITFDVYDKLKPESVAIDSRNGKLIRGTELTRFSRPPSTHLLTDLFDKADWNVEEEGDFDGTTDRYRRKKTR